MVANSVNTIGLGLDILGVLIVFKFGWPQPDLSDTGYIVLEQPVSDDGLRKERKRHLRWSVFGLVSLVAGFGFQIVAVWIR